MSRKKKFYGIGKLHIKFNFFLDLQKKLLMENNSNVSIIVAVTTVDAASYSEPFISVAKQIINSDFFITNSMTLHNLFWKLLYFNWFSS